MARPLEISIENEVVEYAQSKGFFARKMAYVGRRNCPDHWFFGPQARIIIIEFKRHGKTPNAGQQREHDRFIGRGIPVHVIDNVEDGSALFD